MLLYSLVVFNSWTNHGPNMTSFFFRHCISSPVPRTIPNDCPALPVFFFSHCIILMFTLTPRGGLLRSLRLSSLATPWQKISHQFKADQQWQGAVSSSCGRRVANCDAEAWLNNLLAFSRWVNSLYAIVKLSWSLMCYWKLAHPLYTILYNFLSHICHYRHISVIELLQSREKRQFYPWLEENIIAAAIPSMPSGEQYIRWSNKMLAEHYISKFIIRTT